MQDINNVWYKKQISCRQDINFLQTRYLLLKPDSPFHRCQFILRQQSQILKKVQHKDLKYNKCYKHRFYPPPILADVKKSIYICNVFFIVLDLRLTKVGVQRYSFFYTHTYHPRLSQRKKLCLSIIKLMLVSALDFLYLCVAFCGCKHA